MKHLYRIILLFPIAGMCLSVTGDFIYWKPHIGGLEYGVLGVNDGGSDVAHGQNVSRGGTLTPAFSFEPGFKLGLGFSLDADWDLTAQYTSLFGKDQTNSFTSKVGKGAITALDVVNRSGVATPMSVQNGSSSLKQNFHIVDLMVGTNLLCGFKGAFGLKGAWVDEDLSLNFEATSVEISSLQAEQNRRQNMKGVGLRLAVDGFWCFLKHWGFFGDLATSLLWSDFRTLKQDTTVNVIGGPSLNLNSSQTIYEIMPVLEMALGLSYAVSNFEVKAGWEEQVWIDFNHFMDLMRSGDLSLHGLTAQMVWQF